MTWKGLMSLLLMRWIRNSFECMWTMTSTIQLYGSEDVVVGLLSTVSRNVKYIPWSNNWWCINGVIWTNIDWSPNCGWMEELCLYSCPSKWVWIACIARKIYVVNGCCWLNHSDDKSIESIKCGYFCGSYSAWPRNEQDCFREVCIQFEAICTLHCLF